MLWGYDLTATTDNEGKPMLVRVIAKMAHDRVISMSKLPADFPVTEWQDKIMKFNLDYAALMALTALRAVEDEAMSKAYIDELGEIERIASELFANVSQLYDEFEKGNVNTRDNRS